MNVHFYPSFCIDKIQINNVMNFVFVFTVKLFNTIYAYVDKWHKYVLLDPFVCVGRQ